MPVGKKLRPPPEALSPPPRPACHSPSQVIRSHLRPVNSATIDALMNFNARQYSSFSGDGTFPTAPLSRGCDLYVSEAAIKGRTTSLRMTTSFMDRQLGYKAALLARSQNKNLKAQEFQSLISELNQLRTTHASRLRPGPFVSEADTQEFPPAMTHAAESPPSERPPMHRQNTQPFSEKNTRQTSLSNFKAAHPSGAQLTKHSSTASLDRSARSDLIDKADSNLKDIMSAGSSFVGKIQTASRGIGANGYETPLLRYCEPDAATLPRRYVRSAPPTRPSPAAAPPNMLSGSLGEHLSSFLLRGDSNTSLLNSQLAADTASPRPIGRGSFSTAAPHVESTRPATATVVRFLSGGPFEDEKMKSKRTLSTPTGSPREGQEVIEQLTPTQLESVILLQNAATDRPASALPTSVQLGSTENARLLNRMLRGPSIHRPASAASVLVPGSPGATRPLRAFVA